MKTSDIKGIIPPVITPMNNDDEQTVNHEALRQQVERLLAGGVHGMFPLGTNGEAYALSFKEKEEILATVIDQVKGRVPVYAGTGCITTAETIRMSKRAEEMGADALSIITPSFALASQKELYDHYVAVAKQVNIPIILYNIPPRTGNKLLPETVQALCRDVDVIVGAKDSSGDTENLKAYIRLTRELDKDVAIFAGKDDAILTLSLIHISAVKERLAVAYDRCCHENKTCTTVEEKAAWMIARLEAIVKHLDIPTSLKEFGVPAEDLEGLVESGMQVQRLLVNNMRPVTADDARKLYQEIM